MTLPSTRSERAERVAGQATYGMSNLRSQTTGLPFIVFISQRDEARHAARVKVSPGPKVMQSEMGSYAIDPFGCKAGEPLDARDAKLLKQWVDLNREVLQRYWDGEIEYTEDVLALIKKI